ncbi:MAG: hypothetical protein JNK48_18295 [Bryobacterales bacterium]|nr:hypothetical protein [Bryobacterales bacterium]
MNAIMEPDKFVAEKLAMLSADVTLGPAQVDAAWSRMQARRSASARQSVRRRWAGVAAGVALLAILGSSVGRGWAQSLWTWFVLRQALPVSLNMEAASLPLLMPNVFPLIPYGQSRRTSSLAEAEQMTGFHILTVETARLAYAPAFRIEEQPEVTRTIDIAAIRAELGRLGRDPVEEPPGIDGAKVVLRPQGKLVVTSYGKCPHAKGLSTNCAFLVQSRPKVLELSPGVGWKPFVKFSLELAGVQPRLAEHLMAIGGTSPTIFLPNEKGATLEPVRVRGVPGVLVRRPEGKAFVLDWQEAEFHFELHGREADHALEIASTLR